MLLGNDDGYTLAMVFEELLMNQPCTEKENVCGTSYCKIAEQGYGVHRCMIIIGKILDVYVESDLGLFIKYVLICVLTVSSGLVLSSYSDILGGSIIFVFVAWGFIHLQKLVNISDRNGQKNSEAFFYSFAVASILVVSGLIMLASSSLFSSYGTPGFTLDQIFTAIMLFVFITLSVPIIWVSAKPFFRK